ncbi:SpoIID/LytB domain-containing protein [Aminivibrio sp.]|jgi:stage II sporulation protein D|uniref:SpoIID/LytB domain-containing protein n=1 Tax=Aminivibrio sp. TaxID=1872489 RepID=UPI001A3DBA58|nr:SpoIID/LytB domain-containing protein [Aminivibrio sp.]MBL3538944.1 SpoIID/LytB domain-containing protein [Aminivibrio sp.]MDK2958231.1 stage sporulation protein [Synergistaceae bacterium]
MHRTLRVSFAALIILFLFLPSFRAEARMVSVGLSIGQSTVRISSASAMTAADGAGKRHSIGGTAEFRAAGAGTVKTGNHSFRLPVTISGKSPLSFNGRRYRGTFRIISSGAGITLVNVLDLEEYLRGVLKMEINPAWPQETVKAQAIVSRTYALRSIRQNNGKNGFDLRDSVLSQIYRGINAEDKRADQAISATRGVVVLHGGDLAFTPFHSDSGGATADVTNVWGGSMPYLRGVSEPYPVSSPNSSWEVRLSASQVEDALRQAGVDVGPLRDLRIGETDAFGRANTLVAVGARGTQSVKSHAFRMAAGSNVIKSTFFSISSRGGTNDSMPMPLPLRSQTPSPAGGGGKDIPTSNTPMSAAEERQLTALTEQGVFNAEELMDMLLNPEKRKGYLIRALRTRRPEAPSLPSQPQSSSGGFVFRGKGWGHGVGLSQWGAKTLAENGWDHKKIIQFYFPGVTLGKM